MSITDVRRIPYRKFIRHYDLENDAHPNNTAENAQKYYLADFQNTYYLGYRDIPFLLEKYNIGKKAIDYGCGTGRSTRFLKSLGFDAIGVDISKEMLIQATNIDDPSHYFHIKNAQIPVSNNSHDLIFSCFVFFTVPKISDLSAIFKEARRCLKKNGFFIFVTGSEILYSRDWLSYNVNFPENQNLKSGDTARIYLKDLDIEFINYLWTDSDYSKLATETRFKVLEKHFPLGKSDENQKWISETECAPYVIYVLQKK